MLDANLAVVRANPAGTAVLRDGGGVRAPFRARFPGDKAEAVDTFLRGCEEAAKTLQPVHLEGEIERADGRVEQYRCVFIPVPVKHNSLTSLAFGAFSNRLVDKP